MRSLVRSVIKGSGPGAMSRRFSWPLTAVFVVIAFAPGSGRAGAKEPPNGAAKGFACPSTDFVRFLDAFAESADVQRAFTRLPLTRRHFERRPFGDPVPVEEQLPAGKLDFPVFPGAETRTRQNFSLKLRERVPDRREVVLFEADTDHQIVFTFERAACWRLVLVDDQSP